jgi:hypothetical protein
MLQTKHNSASLEAGSHGWRQNNSNGCRVWEGAEAQGCAAITCVSRSRMTSTSSEAAEKEEAAAAAGSEVSVMSGKLPSSSGIGRIVQINGTKCTQTRIWGTNWETAYCMRMQLGLSSLEGFWLLEKLWKKQKLPIGKFRWKHLVHAHVTASGH